MTPVEAVELALSKEEASINLYRKMANEHHGIRDLLFSLLNEEEKHKKLLAEKLVELRR